MSVLKIHIVSVPKMSLCYGIKDALMMNQGMANIHSCESYIKFSKVIQ